MSKSRTRKQLEAAVGGLSKPSKMPCHGYSIPAHRCITGSKLRLQSDSTCSACYALKGRYVFPNVLEAMERRFHILMKDMNKWVDDMVELISRFEKSGYFRWHDSGDIQSVEHFQAIIDIAFSVPHVKFWLPTRELRILRDWATLNKGVELPSNLTVRLSSYFVGSAMNLPAFLTEAGVKLSTVGLDDVTDDVHFNRCPAQKQGNKCQSCRACWDRSVYCVDYPLH